MIKAQFLRNIFKLFNLFNSQQHFISEIKFTVIVLELLSPHLLIFF